MPHMRPEPASAPPPVERGPDGKFVARAPLAPPAAIAPAASAASAPAAPAVPAPASAPPAASPPSAASPTAIEPLTEEPPPEVRRSLSAHENWKRITQSAADFRKQAEARAREVEAANAKVKELEASLSKYSALPVAPDAIAAAIAERDRLTKEHAEIVSQLETVNLERSPRFQTWWKTETDKHIKVVQRLVPADKREEVGKLLLAPLSDSGPALDAIITTLPASTQHIIAGAMSQLEAAKLQREEALTQGSQRYRELQEFERQERLKAEQASAARREQLTTAALTKARAFDAFKPNPSDAEHAAAITQREAFVQAAIAGKLDEDVLVAMPGLAAHALYLQDKIIPRLRADLEAANALIKQLQGSSPRPSEGGLPTPATSPSNAPPGSEFAARMKELWPGTHTGG